MDEAETLCDKIAIMINGRFVCLGTPLHLKEKYGDGYQLIVKVSRGQDPEYVNQHIITQIPLCIKQLSLLDEYHQN